MRDEGRKGERERRVSTRVRLPLFNRNPTSVHAADHEEQKDKTHLAGLQKRIENQTRIRERVGREGVLVLHAPRVRHPRLAQVGHQDVVPTAICATERDRQTRKFPRRRSAGLSLRSRRTIACSLTVSGGDLRVHLAVAPGFGGHRRDGRRGQRRVRSEERRRRMRQGVVQHRHRAVVQLLFECAALGQVAEVRETHREDVCTVIDCILVESSLYSSGLQ